MPYRRMRFHLSRGAALRECGLPARLKHDPPSGACANCARIAACFLFLPFTLFTFLASPFLITQLNPHCISLSSYGLYSLFAMTRWIKDKFSLKDKCLPSETAPVFEFLEPGLLQDGELCLRLAATYSSKQTVNGLPCYRFEMYREKTHQAMGSIDLRIGNARELTHYAGHIGYEVDPRYRGHHYAERSVRLLFDLVRRHQLAPLWITCNPDNWASRRTCERLGGVMVEILAVPPWHELYRRGEHFKCRYRVEV